MSAAFGGNHLGFPLNPHRVTLFAEGLTATKVLARETLVVQTGFVFFAIRPYPGF